MDGGLPGSHHAFSLDDKQGISPISSYYSFRFHTGRMIGGDCVTVVGGPGSSVVAMSQLKQIGPACHNLESTYQTLPMGGTPIWPAIDIRH